MLLGTSSRRAHAVVHLFCDRSGRIPQPLQVLLFALPRSLPQRAALTLWKLWNNLKLVSRDFADTYSLGLVFKSKMQGWMAQWYWYFACKTFQFSQLFPHEQPEAVAGPEYCLCSTNAYLRSFCALTKKTGACSVWYSSPYLYGTLSSLFYSLFFPWFCSPWH